jgi:23S rRNA (cytosine1962-C5)-methyltransferase
MRIAHDWNEYELLDAGDGEKLERWGSYVLRRPDPQAIWPKGNDSRWERADARYERSSDGGGKWIKKPNMRGEWTVSYRELVFRVECMGFKHTGLFPEQSENWKWIGEKIRSADKPVRVLNLFAYTGGATVAAAASGADVCHVDSSKGMNERAKENARLSGLLDAPIRFITDDAMKFVEREIRRGRTYEAIILDPPSFGRGPKGEIWKIEQNLFPLLRNIVRLLSDRAIFVLVNSYTTGLSPAVIRNALVLSTEESERTKGGVISSFELGLHASARDIILPCGASGRWERDSGKYDTLSLT